MRIARFETSTCQIGSPVFTFIAWNDAVGAADDQRRRLIDLRDDRRRVVGVVVTRLRRADPDGLSGALVEGEIAIAGTVQVAPRQEQRVENHLVAVHDRRGGAAAVRGDGAVVFGQRSIPEHLAVGRQRQQLRADGEHVDVAGLGIDGRRRPAGAVLRHVAQVDAEAVLPDHLAGFGIERDEALLRRRRDRRRLTADRGDCRRRPATSGRRSARATRGCRPGATTSTGDCVSVERPSRVGPRHSGQSLARSPLVPTIVPATSMAAVASRRRFVGIMAAVANRDIARVTRAAITRSSYRQELADEGVT